MSVVVVATLYPLPEHRAAVLAALEESIPAVHADDEGCELYALNEGRDRFVMVEKWASPELLAAHGKGAHLAALTAAVEGKLASPLDVQVLTPHPAGTAEQGTV